MNDSSRIIALALTHLFNAAPMILFVVFGLVAIFRRRRI